MTVFAEALLEPEGPVLLEFDGEVEDRLTEVDGQPVCWPNDVAIAADGAIWGTDTGVRHADWVAADNGRHPVDVDGRVYRYDVDEHGRLGPREKWANLLEGEPERGRGGARRDEVGRRTARSSARSWATARWRCSRRRGAFASA